MEQTVKQTLKTKAEQKQRQLTKENKQELKEDVYTVNPKIHLNSDVPEEVQQFIKSISSDPQAHKENNISDVNLLGVKKINPL